MAFPKTRETEVRQKGVGFFGLLALVFITLKLCNVITWPWMLVLAPIWAPILLAFIILTVMLFIALIDDEKAKKKKVTINLESEKLKK